MGIKDKISKIFSNPTASPGESNVKSSNTGAKATIHGTVHSGGSVQHGHIDIPETEEVADLKTENISSQSDESDDESEGDKPQMNEENNKSIGTELSEAKIYDVLSNVYDPEIPIDIVNLGLIYGIDIIGDKVEVKMTMTSPGCPASVQITSESKYLIEELDGVSEANIEIVWDPPWDPGRMSEEARQSMGFT